MSSRLGRATAATFAVLMFVGIGGGIGFSTQALLEGLDREELAVGESFATLTDGRKLRYREQGRGQPGPVIVLVAGLGAALESWDTLLGAFPSTTHVVAFDRAGIGLSDPDPLPVTAARVANDIVSLLDALEIRERVVPVCFSIGGLFCHVLAVKHRERVAGLVLMDPSHPDEWTNVAKESAESDIDEFFSLIPRHAVKTSLGLVRLKRFLSGAAPKPNGTAGDRREAAFDANSTHWKSIAKEAASIYTLHSEMRAAALPSDLPLVILSAEALGRPDVEQVVQNLHKQWSEQTLSGRHFIVKDADHLSLRDGPENARIVAKRTLEMLEQSKRSH